MLPTPRTCETKSASADQTSRRSSQRSYANRFISVKAITGRASSRQEPFGGLGAPLRWLTCTVVVAVVTGVIELLQARIPVLSLSVLYLLAVLPIAVVWGVTHAVAVSVASMLAFNFFFLPPLYTFTLADSRNWFALGVFVVTAIVVSELAARTRRQARESALLAQVASSLLEHGEVSAELERIAAEVARALRVERARIFLGRAHTPANGGDGYPLAAGGRRVGTIVLDRSPRSGSAARRRLMPALAPLLAGIGYGILPHAALLLLMLARQARRQPQAERIDRLMLVALTYILWFVALPLWHLA